MAPPTHRSAAFSDAASRTKNEGQASTGYFVRNEAFPDFSVSIESQTNCPACFARVLSVKTKALRERHVCHQGAQFSTKIGRFLARASTSAFP